MMIEAMSDGGVLVGLPSKVSTELAAQTVRGAVRGALMKAVRRASLKSIKLGKVYLTTDGS